MCVMIRRRLCMKKNRYEGILPPCICFCFLCIPIVISVPYVFFHISFVYFFTYFVTSGLVPTKLIFPPDVKIETTFFQRNFFSTIPCNYPQKQHKKRTSDLSEVPILRCFLKILPLSASLPASYQIPPDCTPNGIFPSNDTSFPHPIRTFSISFAALAHY